MKNLLIIIIIFITAVQVELQAQNKIDSSGLAAPNGLTAKKIIDNYINAIGGKENLLKVKDRTTVMNGTVEGREVRMTIYQKAPNKMREIISTGTFKQNIYFNGKKGVMEVAGKKMDVKGIELEKLKYESKLYFITELDSLGIKLKFTGRAKVDSINAYKIEMTLPSGLTWIQYFDPHTWFKLRESKLVVVPQGRFTQNTYFGNYQKVDGIKYPFSIKQTLGKQKMTFRVTMISVNDNLNDQLFEVP